MPEEGLNWLSRTELMSYEEMLHISSVLVRMGVEKIRITGGEPFVRKDLMSFLTRLSQLEGLRQLTLTTNGVLTAPFVPALQNIGVASVNLSLDTLDPERFLAITRRDEFANVMATLDALLKYGLEVKINAVVMEGKNTEDILPLVQLTKDIPVSVRFIEEMPFNGGSHHASLTWDYVQILNTIRDKYPQLKKLQDPPFSTSFNYQIPGHKGSVGVIPAYTRSFCGSCNRIRLTPQGDLKTCLYGKPVLNVKDLMRAGTDAGGLEKALLHAVGDKEKDGWEAAQHAAGLPVLNASMATIGG